MSLLKTRHKGLKSIPGILLVAAVCASSYLAYSEWHTVQNAWISQASIQRLYALNAEHEMVIDPLLDEHWYLQTDLFQANTLDLDRVEKENHQGLLVTLDENVADNAFLLLQPAHYTSERDLETLAQVYEEAIPEFLNVEVDQNVFLQGEPHYWVIPDEWVNLTDETEEETDDGDLPLPNPIQVGVIDSGLDPYHEIFEDVTILTGWNTITDDTIMYDDIGHGTHIAGILSMNAENIEIIPYKIVDASGGRLSNVLEAFDRAIEDQPDIINASFGLMSPSVSLEKMMDEAEEAGIIVVAAAGNSNSSKGFYPATYDNTIAVASLTTDGEAMEKSNYGNWIDVATLGQAVYSALPDNTYGYKSGTSQAAANISAHVAMLLQDGGYWTLTNVIHALQEGSEHIESGKLAGVAIVE